MNELAAITYGLIQGLTEFLPVSSSGHLALLPHFLKIEDPGVFFDLSMHVGTALSILLYFQKEVRHLIKQALNVLIKPKEFSNEAYVINMILATITTVFWVFLLKGFAENYGRDPKIIVINLVVFGLLMIIADKFFVDNETGMMDKPQFGKASLVGFFQALAIFPGVSRSGSTLTISRFLGLGREEATRFSFLLSLPLIFGGFLYKLPEASGENFQLIPCFIGVFVSFITGLVTIHFFLKFIKRIGLLSFGIYRFILAGVIFSLL
ncbi:MAG: undecaprenyl-diphosphate phosphatase [Halobacteriovoraceae bacterium]|nr:undecaprenyl-diphosphate phosphatase [Halobacteriovoraceae bacterium]